MQTDIQCSRQLQATFHAMCAGLMQPRACPVPVLITKPPSPNGPCSQGSWPVNPVPGMIALLPIYIALAFLPRLPSPCATKETSLWTSITWVPVEIRNHRDIGKPEDLWGDNLWLSQELFDVFVADSLFKFFIPFIFLHMAPAIGNNNKK